MGVATARDNELHNMVHKLVSDESVPVKLARIEERLINHSSFMQEAVVEMRTHREAHEKRISSLERWRSWLIGAGAVVSAVISFVITKLTSNKS